jgi:hypothetical protein
MLRLGVHRGRRFEKDYANEKESVVKRRPIGVGIIGGGLMGREIAGAFAR